LPGNDERSVSEEGHSEISDQEISDQTGRIPQNCSNSPINLRERVLTIENDSRMSPPPFERALAVGREVVSDIQAFGYDPDDLQQTAFSTRPPAAWRLLRQDLYLNGQPRAFLIVHWKHTLDFISLVDVIPGDETEWVR
jgi:hypothetical protein